MDKYAKAVEEAKQMIAGGDNLGNMWIESRPSLLFGRLPNYQGCLLNAFFDSVDGEFPNLKVQKVLTGDKRLAKFDHDGICNRLVISDLEIFADIRRKVDPMLEGEKGEL